MCIPLAVLAATWHVRQRSEGCCDPRWQQSKATVIHRLQRSEGGCDPKAAATRRRQRPNASTTAVVMTSEVAATKWRRSEAAAIRGGDSDAIEVAVAIPQRLRSIVRSEALAAPSEVKAVRGGGRR